MSERTELEKAITQARVDERRKTLEEAIALVERKTLVGPCSADGLIGAFRSLIDLTPVVRELKP